VILHVAFGKGKKHTAIDISFTVFINSKSTDSCEAEVGDVMKISSLSRDLLVLRRGILRILRLLKDIMVRYEVD
jgi:hypothetical protein